MKGWLLKEIGNIEYGELPMPAPSDDEVMIKVRAAGICGSDIPRVYQNGAWKMPLVVGHEFSGELVEPDDEGAYKATGRRFAICPLIPCKECTSCKKELYEMCKSYKYLGSRNDGGYAEYVKVSKWNLLELPDGVCDEAAAMLEPLSVAIHAYRKLSPKPDENVLVYGAGTIGLLLVMVLQAMGINNIIVVGNKEFQKNKLKEIGIDEKFFIDSRNEDVSAKVGELVAEDGVDVVFECVGKSETVEMAIDLAAPGARVCLVGNPHGDMTLNKNVYWKILRRQLIVRGTWNSSFTRKEDDDWHLAISLIERGKVTPQKLITHRLPLDKLEEGLMLIRDKKEDYIKVMVKP